MLRPTHTFDDNAANYALALPIFLNLLASEKLKEVDITLLQRRIFKGDFFGLLRQKNVPSSHWTLTLLANQLEHSGQYKGEATIKLVDGGSLDALLGQASTGTRVRLG